tara:strand:+ start:338 stop:526 length:189 start_codon:yes stop_codon:yes gene_type:complete
MINWINSWKSSNKKEQYRLELRIGTLTLLEMQFCPCSVKECKTKKKSCARFRFMIFNVGFEI